MNAYEYLAETAKRHNCHYELYYLLSSKKHVAEFKTHGHDLRAEAATPAQAAEIIIEKLRSIIPIKYPPEPLGQLGLFS